MAALDTTLNQRMRKYLNAFFSSLRQGDNISLSSFVSSFSTFHDTVRTHHDKLQVDTLATVQSFASVIDAVAVNILELEKESEKLRLKTLEDISEIAERRLPSLALNEKSNSRPPKDEKMTPAYIKPSYEWLVLHLHNPYPSKEVKADIAHKSRCSVRDIDAWFIDARKRIGWNRLRKDRFSNKQDKIIAAATRFFKPFPSTFTDELNATLRSDDDLDDAYRADFTALEDAARSLYSGRFIDLPPSLLSSRRGRREPSATFTRAEDSWQHEQPTSSPSAVPGGQPSAMTPSKILKIDVALSYPTPEPSPSQSGEVLSPTSPISVHGQSRKRRQPSIEPPQFEGKDLTRPQKRLRQDTSGLIAPSNNLPSPALTFDLSEDRQQEHPYWPEPIRNSSVKRKRRLSDGDNARPVKRPHNSLAMPRLQTVSDPFPLPRPFIEDSFVDWFNGNFNSELQLSDAVPSAASLEVQESSETVSLEVHCHTYDDSPYQQEPTFLSRVSPEGLSPESSRSDDISTSLVLEDLPVHDSLLGVNTTETINSDQSSLALDFDFQPASQETISRDRPFNPLDQILNFDSFVQHPPLDFNWMLFPPGDSVDSVEFSTSYATEFSNFCAPHSNIPQDPVVPEDHDAKQLRLQFLREELNHLESEIDFP